MTEQQDFMKMAENARRAQEAINALGAGPFRAGTPDGLYDAHGFPIPAVQAFPGAPLVGIGGPLGSGKDALADYLVENHGYQKTFMSEPLHEALATINPWIVFEQDPQHDGIVYPTRYVDLVELVGYTEAKRTPEVRRLLQALGTEVGRNMMGETVWTDMAQKKIRSWRSKGLPVVITGIRFPNELEMIREMGGVSVWVHRPQDIDALVDGAIHGHSSETSLSREDFDLTVHNTGSLDDLEVRAAELAAYVREQPNELEARFLADMS